MGELIDRIKELFELYDEYGSEMPENETNFIELLLSKAQDRGLTLEALPPDVVERINQLHTKYSKIESFDSSESDDDSGMA